MSRRYVSLRYPWGAVIGTASEGPAKLLATLARQALGYGLAGRRAPAAWALAARHARLGWLAPAVGKLPRGPQDGLDALLADVAAAWPRLAGDAALPPDPGTLDALALTRRAAFVVFVFAAGEPVLVLKLPREGEAVAHEASVLERIRELDLAPRPVGRVGSAYAQTLLEGTPLEPPPIDPGRAGALAWPPALERLCERLAGLAAHTAAGAPPEASMIEPIERAMRFAPVSARARGSLSAAVRDLRAGPSVVNHGDVSPQNVLCAGGAPRGLVDWADAVVAGPPGFDVLNAAIAYLDAGVARARWSAGRAVETFVAAWGGPYGAGARRALAASVAAAGAPERMAGALEAAYFGCVLGMRMERPGEFPTGADALIRMLEAV